MIVILLDLIFFSFLAIIQMKIYIASKTKLIGFLHFTNTNTALNCSQNDTMLSCLGTKLTSSFYN